MNPITKISWAVLAIMLVGGGVGVPAKLAAQTGPQRLTLSEAQAIIAAAQRGTGHHRGGAAGCRQQEPSTQHCSGRRSGRPDRCHPDAGCALHDHGHGDR